ncbi:MAG: S-layer homology domain-containing protein [Candidatus Gracilibacteria bacterium]
MNFRKSIFLSVLFLLLTSQLVSAAIIETLIYEDNFSDVEPTDVEILYLAEIGVISGYSDGTVQSTQAVNRAETSKIFGEMMGLDNTYDSGCTFSDVEEDSWYAGYVSAMCNIGVIGGYPDGTFQGASQLNRAEAIKILVSSLGVEIPEYATNLASDIPEGVWYQDYANYAIDRNLVPLFDGEFGGSYTYTRGDLFTNVYRIKRLEELGEYTYDTSMDPMVISNSAADGDHDTNVTFDVTGTDEDAIDYINSFRFDLDERYTGVTLPMSYEDVMYNLSGNFREELGQMLPLPLRFDYENILRKDVVTSYDFTPLVSEFFSEFGVDISGKSIDDDVTESEYETVIASLKDHILSDYKEALELQILFNMVSEDEISLKIAGYRDADLVSLEEWDTEYEEYSKHVNPPDVEVYIYDNDTDELVYETDLNGLNTNLDSNDDGDKRDDYVQIDLTLDTPLEDGKTYRMELSPIYMTSYPWNETPNGAFSGDDVYLPASEFTFDNKSTLEFVYTDGDEQEVTGMAFNFGLIWQRSWGMPLDGSAFIYDQNGYLMDMDDVVSWTVVDGGGTIAVNDEGYTIYTPASTDNVVVLEATYKGLTEQMTVYMVDSMGV